jgi:hypothetical protein
MPTIKTAPSSPLRYDTSIERPEPDEAETAAAIVKSLRGINEKVFQDSGHAVRSVHAKGHGMMNGTLRVLDNLPPELAQGLFATPGATYPVLMRISTIPGDVLDDKVSVPRGMAVKVMNVPGERLPGSEADTSQDFVMVNGPAFASPTAKAFLGALKLLAATTDRVAWLKRLLSEVTRPIESLIYKMTGKHSLLVALGGHPATHPLGETYYSQAPLLYGQYIAKISLKPLSPSVVALADAPVDLSGTPDGLRKAVSAFFKTNGGEWELRAQLCTDLEKMPVEDASVVWPEEVSPFIAVARITLPPQDSWSPENVREMDRGMAFNVWRGLAAHRPLGSIMRVRKPAYAMSQRYRVEHNGA